MSKGDPGDFMISELQLYKQGKGGQVSRELLGMGRTNRYVSVRLARWLIVARAMNNVMRFPFVEGLCSDCEQTQMCVSGYSREQFIEGVKAEFQGAGIGKEGGVLGGLTGSDSGK